MNLISLLQTFGWQIALVGLLGTIIVGLLKKPFSFVVNKIAKKEISDTSFDTAAFLLGFVVALILGIVYSILASHFAWVDEYTWVNWIMSIFGTWGCQVSYYNIWKKLGLKRLLIIIWEAIKQSIKNKADKNKDIEEAAQVLDDLLGSGKLSLNDFMDCVRDTAPGVAENILNAIINEAGVEGTFDFKKNTDTLQELITALISNVPQDALTAIVEDAEGCVDDEEADEPEQPEPAPETPKQETIKAEQPKKPVIKF